MTLSWERPMAANEAWVDTTAGFAAMGRSHGALA